MTPESSRRNWLGIAALLACGLAAAATSPFAISNPRSYPLWKVERGTTTVGSTHLAAWVSKSGKTGIGLTVAADRCGSTPPNLRVERVELRLDGSAQSFAGKPAIEMRAPPPAPAPPAPATRQPASAPASAPTTMATTKAKKKGPAEPPPPPSIRRLFYIPVPFDSETAWNEGRNQAQVVLELRVEGKPHRWALQAHQSRKGFHRSLSIGAQRSCPTPKAPCAAPDQGPTRGRGPTSPDAGAVLERAPDGGSSAGGDR